MAHAWRPHDGDAPGTAGLVALLAGGRVAVLTGAGISTESGIPDYRGPTGARTRSGPPMTYQEFVGGPAARRRYWARSFVGWRAITRAEPNDGHRAVARLQRAGLVTGLVTQNVDGLHQAAGSGDVVELHGALDRVVCLGCSRRSPREELHDRLAAANPRFTAVGATRVNPDGDVELDEDLVAGFRVVDCTACGGLLKPDVVFFGENVPRDRVERCYGIVDAARALLVLGSSLTVMSGLRFVRHAARHGIPVAVVNQGPTRGDDLVSVRVDAPLGEVLPRVAQALDAGSLGSAGSSGSSGSADSAHVVAEELDRA
ncbi:NAD-dependent protein deacetylase [Thalassiella azotivora]